MASSVIIRPKAREDIIECALFIAEDNPDAAVRFLQSVETTAHQLADNPSIGRLRQFLLQEMEGIRSFPVDHFPKHLIFYRRDVYADVDVIRVLHGAMDVLRILDLDE